MWKSVLLAAGLMLSAVVHAAEVQQARKFPRIGLLGSRTFEAARSRERPFIEALRELGWIEGQNIYIERRYTGHSDSTLSGAAAELVRLKVNVIVVRDSTAIRPAMQATKTIPIVFVVSGDPVQTGYIDTLARPGGNVTGLTNVSPQLAGKRLELLKEAVPGVSRVAVLGPPNLFDRKELAFVAQQLRVELQSVGLQAADELRPAFEAAKSGRAEALVVLPSPITNSLSRRIVRFAANDRLPAVYGTNVYVEAGGLMSYGPNLAALSRRAANYVHRILKGANPAELPVEQPMKFELLINLKAAKEIGLTMPGSLLFRADRVIR
jgi:putative ABC transport system substrate-binding protein